jgi:hypothetical protein
MSESYLGATESILRWILYEQKKDLSCEVVLRILGGSRHQRLLKHRNGADQVLTFRCDKISLHLCRKPQADGEPPPVRTTAAANFANSLVKAPSRLLP